MKITETDIPGCLIIDPPVFDDRRGRFVKQFSDSQFRKHGLCTTYLEDFVSVSHKNVLRGMHFQLPPHDHTKLVWCSAGVIFDAVVDLRKGSPTFGHHLTCQLDDISCRMLYIPPGLAHGFMVIDGPAIVNYKVSSEYQPDHDAGIHWNSADIRWPGGKKTVSDRDESLPTLKHFDSPFEYQS